ncbi:hypothetical protein F5I97DRAFT_1810606 [Phlebopus sp. FC_14]|nr:hypothetical protein F5I97DRAFT_1810606 [Phlebopus sp. FC_14]
MPALEPLSEPQSEVSSLRGRSLVQPAPTRTLHETLAEPSKSTASRFGHVIEGCTAPFKLSLVLENKGNVARDHLASERTYLAYVRTSLACASAGVAIVQLFALSSSVSVATQHQGAINTQKFAKPLGATVVLFGLGILILGVARYFMTQMSLIRGYFPVARHSITVVAFIMGALVGIVFGVLIAGMR